MTPEGRELTALGHTVKLMPPAYVKAYVKRNKDDAGAEAICEAVTRPTMRFVPVKDAEHPTKVVRAALQHAASVAGLLITTEAMVAEKPERQAAAGGPPGGMGDMDF